MAAVLAERSGIKRMGSHARGVGAGFDVVFMEMKMPELSGDAATRRLRSWGFAGPIVAPTAQATEGDRERRLGAGVRRLLEQAGEPVGAGGGVRVVGAGRGRAADGGVMGEGFSGGGVGPRAGRARRLRRRGPAPG